MPIEELLKAYIDEHIEEDIEEEISEQKYNVTEPKKDNDIWEPINTDLIKKDNEEDNNLTVSNNIVNDLPLENKSQQKAITFNENIDDNTDDDPIKITDEDVKIEFDSFDQNEPSNDSIDLEIEELP